MEEFEEEPLDPRQPWTPEPLLANGKRVYTADMGLCLVNPGTGPTTGLTDAEARRWASLFANAPRMYALIQEFVSGDLNRHARRMEMFARAKQLLELCVPNPIGEPFKRRVGRLAMCRECAEYPADKPKGLCPGCEAYRSQGAI